MRRNEVAMSIEKDQIASLTGQIAALTIYVRALVDKHPRAQDVLRHADCELEAFVASLLAKPASDAMLEGVDRVRQMVGQARKS